MHIPIVPWGNCVKNLEGVQVFSLHCLPILIQNAVNIALLFSGVVALFLILWSGILLITSNGYKSKVYQAKQTLTYTIIGLVFIILAWSILNVLYNLIGYRPLRGYYLVYGISYLAKT